MAVAFGLVLMSERPPGAEEQWLITVGTVALAGILVGALKANVERLIGRLAAAAHTDPLTGLSNRRAFQDTLEVELERARRGERPVSLLVADLDHFKRVNDLLGHPSGRPGAEAVRRPDDQAHPRRRHPGARWAARSSRSCCPRPPGTTPFWWPSGSVVR